MTLAPLETFRELIRKARTSAGLSAEVAARKCGLSATYYRAVERGKIPRVPVIFDIIKTFGLDPLRTIALLNIEQAPPELVAGFIEAFDDKFDVPADQAKILHQLDILPEPEKTKATHLIQEMLILLIQRPRS